MVVVEGLLGITDGVYEILVGACSADVCLRRKLLVEKGKPKIIEDHD